jgi:hypothetical protein
MTETGPERTSIENVLKTCARVLGRRPIAPTPDAIAALATSPVWSRLPSWTILSDEEIALRAGLYTLAFASPLLVVTDAALAKSDDGAFVVEANELMTLVSDHLRWMGECFFNGDVVIVERDGRRIWLFHHEGQYALLSPSDDEPSRP